jgi:2,4-dienoyl-CoA reductase-like NADH-dependent reductase (Old Yellow Enzyme family)
MKHFTYRTLEELRRSASELGASHVRFEDDKSKIQAALGQPVPVGPVTVGNAMAIHPMEGCDATLDGAPDELTLRRYERFGRGGAKLIWFEATAVVPEGRANTRQLWIHERNVGAYARMLEMTLKVHREEFGRDDDVLAPLQLTHSGRYSVPRRIIAYHNPLIDEKTGISPGYPIISDDELERLADHYLAAAKLAYSAGFRAFDLKVTHGYLLSELMGAKTREGKYGGPLENRMRLIKEIFGRWRAEFGARVVYCMRMSVFDGVPYRTGPDANKGVPLPYSTPYPYGYGVDPNDPLRDDLAEPKQAIAKLRDWGLQLLNVSLGCPYYNPHIGRPFEKPDEGNYEQPEHPLLGVDRHFRIAADLQRSFPDLPMVGTGYSWLQKYSINAGAHNVASGAIRFFGMGRNVLAYPDFARAVLERGELDELRVCKTLTYCTFLMRQKNHPLGQFPAGCPPFDKLVYGPIMKEARESYRKSLAGK